MSVLIHRHGPLAEVVLDRAPVNAFDADQVEDLARVVSKIRDDTRIHAVLVHGERMFSAGADIAMLDSWKDQPDQVGRTVAFVRRLQEVYAEVAALPVPTVAAVTRAATGAGLELALACDIRFVAEDARVGLPEPAIGLIPGAGGTQRLTRLAGPGVAADLILTARLVSGTEAVRLGIAQHSAPGDDLLEAARTAATALAALPRNALAATKRCLAAAGTSHGFETELSAVGELIASESTQDLLSAFAGRSRSRTSPSPQSQTSKNQVTA